MGSIIFSDEEARYVKVLLRWQDSTFDHEKAKRELKGLLEAKAEAQRKQPVGELRILVAGAKGTGKTSILTKVNPDPPCIHTRHMMAVPVSLFLGPPSLT